MALIERPCGNGLLEVQVAPEKVLNCLICGNNRFHERDTLLNTRAATFFKVDWANTAAANYICSQCGFIHWFLKT